MLTMKRGCKIAHPELLAEQYEVSGDRIHANVNADKIEQVVRHFIHLQDGPLFFILELPASKEEEDRLRERAEDCLHCNVYYIDGCNQEDALAILRHYGELLIHDGMCRFGFGAHQSGDEIMVGKYNVVTIFTHTIEKYHSFYELHEIPETQQLMTAWDTFSGKSPGECVRIEINGRDVSSVLDDLKEWGIYLAEQRED